MREKEKKWTTKRLFDSVLNLAKLRIKKQREHFISTRYKIHQTLYSHIFAPWRTSSFLLAEKTGLRRLKTEDVLWGWPRRKESDENGDNGHASPVFHFLNHHQKVLMFTFFLKHLKDLFFTYLPPPPPPPANYPLIIIFPCVFLLIIITTTPKWLLC